MPALDCLSLTSAPSPCLPAPLHAPPTCLLLFPFLSAAGSLPLTCPTPSSAHIFAIAIMSQLHLPSPTEQALRRQGPPPPSPDYNITIVGSISIPTTDVPSPPPTKNDLTSILHDTVNQTVLESCCCPPCPPSHQPIECFGALMRNASGGTPLILHVPLTLVLPPLISVPTSRYILLLTCLLSLTLCSLMPISIPVAPVIP